jgi:hypothetical protein
LAEILTRRIVRERKEGRTFQAIANSLMANTSLPPEESVTGIRQPSEP